MKCSKEQIEKIFKESIQEETFVKLTISDLKGQYEYKKVIMKPVEIKGLKFMQLESFKDNKAFHSNLPIQEAVDVFSSLLDLFKQFLFSTSTEEMHILKGKNNFNLKSKKTEKKEISLSHNKKKNYLISDSIPTPFLIRLGVMTENGVVTKDKFNKFRQINRYLEFIEDTLKDLKSKNLIDNKMTIVDFGCGKSYLTFALYHYLKNVKEMDVDIIGLDLKEDVISHCSQIAQDLNFSNLKFLKGDIKEFNSFKQVDMIFSLHACNNATDYSILKGLELGAKAILAVPCCQSEINQKINKSNTTELKNTLSPFGNHGILQERFSSLATDALRALALELCGFNTKVMEFIDMEHTPKNILIKAIKSPAAESSLRDKRAEYDRYLNFLGVNPLIDQLLKDYFLK